MSDSVTNLKPRHTAAITPACLSDQGLADYLDVSPRLIRQWRASEILPAPVEMPGRLTRWRKSDIDEWLSHLPTKK